MEEANGLVRWLEEAPGLGQGDEGPAGAPLVELPHKTLEKMRNQKLKLQQEVRQHAPDAVPCRGREVVRLHCLVLGSERRGGGSPHHVA